MVLVVVGGEGGGIFVFKNYIDLRFWENYEGIWEFLIFLSQICIKIVIFQWFFN